MRPLLDTSQRFLHIGLRVSKFGSGAKGILRLLSYYPHEVGRNMDEILRAVTALQVASEHGVATPAGWPHNELIGDRVIVPPATDQGTAQQRAEATESYDWWFVHKKL